MIMLGFCRSGHIRTVYSCTSQSVTNHWTGHLADPTSVPDIKVCVVYVLRTTYIGTLTTQVSRLIVYVCIHNVEYLGY